MYEMMVNEALIEDITFTGVFWWECRCSTHSSLATTWMLLTSSQMWIAATSYAIFWSHGWDTQPSPEISTCVVQWWLASDYCLSSKIISSSSEHFSHPIPFSHHWALGCFIIILSDLGCMTLYKYPSMPFSYHRDTIAGCYAQRVRVCANFYYRNFWPAQIYHSKRIGSVKITHWWTVLTFIINI